MKYSRYLSASVGSSPKALFRPKDLENMLKTPEPIKGLLQEIIPDKNFNYINIKIISALTWDDPRLDLYAD